MDQQGQQVREAVLEATEVVLEAQLRAVRSLRKQSNRATSEQAPSRRRGRSQLDMAFDILSSSEPLHVSTLIERIRERFGIGIDRESLVSALSKRVARQDRFRRVGRNVFGVIGEGPEDQAR